MDDFGGKLRQARERRGISLRQIASSTKIAAAALDALEKNDISKLPGGIFSRAFVRSYAVEVGLDPDDTVKEFLERFNQEPPPSAESMAAAIPEEEKQFEQRQRQAAKALAFGVALFVVVIVILYFVLRGRRVVVPEPPPPPVAAEPAAPPAPAPDATPLADAGAPTGATPVAGQLKLEVRPVSECWVSIIVDGRKLSARVMQAGERQSYVVQREAIVEVGDAGAFAFSVNGRPGKPLGDKGQVKTLKLTPSTFAQYVK
ncbi:MAG TPA: RodZ domain-containing protein [Vicinamibacterales bacterium]